MNRSRRSRSNHRFLLQRLFFLLVTSGVLFVVSVAQKDGRTEKPVFSSSTNGTRPSSAPAEHNTSEGNFTIERVSDGDTLRLSNGERVRLIGIDTPESSFNRKLERDARRSGLDAKKIVAMGKEAARFAKSLADGRKVKIICDVQTHDKYGRLLAYVYLPVCLGRCDAGLPPEGHYYVELEDGTYDFLNATLVASGYAQVYTVSPNVKHRALFLQLQREARKEHRGLWHKTDDFSTITRE